MPFITQPRSSAIQPKIGIVDLLKKSNKSVFPPKISIVYGTGSYPPLENGLHLNILQAASKLPLSAPCF